MNAAATVATLLGQSAVAVRSAVRRYGVVKLLTGLVTLSLVPLASIELTV